MTRQPDPTGRLVYVMGPSGAGKDTLLGYARERVDPKRVVFAHRYITRAADAGGENHVALSDKEFSSRQAAGLFALQWASHGFNYAIGAEINLWLGCGLVVVASGARAVWPHARVRYPNIIGVLIDAPMELRARRLAARGRENELAIRERLAREVRTPPGDGIRRIDNSGSVESSGDILTSIIGDASSLVME
jgi:ribose 1,5-bisphosphokinase